MSVDGMLRGLTGAAHGDFFMVWRGGISHVNWQLAAVC